MHTDQAYRGLRWGWFGICAASLAFMFTHTSDSGIFFGRYSLTFGLLLTTMLALTLGTGAACIPAVWRRVAGWSPRLPAAAALAWGIAFGGSVAIGLLWLLLPGARHKPQIALFMALLLITLGGLYLGGLRWLPAAQRPLAGRWLGWTGIAAGAAIVGVALFAVGRVPGSLIFDEGWLANWGYSMFSQREAVATMTPTRAPGFIVVFSIWLPVQGAWQSLMGLTYEQTRLFWLLLGWGCVPFVFLAGRRLYGAYAGGVAALLAAGLVVGHNYIRPDAFVAPALAAALYFLISAWQTGARWRYVAAGVALALTVEGHPLAGRYILLIGGYLTWRYLAQLWRGRRWYVDAAFWGVGVGGLLYFGLYLALRTLPWGLSLEELVTQGRFVYQLNVDLGSSGGLTGLPLIFNVARELLLNYVVLYPLDVALGIAVSIFALWRRQPADLGLLGLGVGGLALLFVLTPKYNIYYYQHQIPLLALLGGALLAQVAGAAARHLRLTHLAVWLLVAACFMAQTLREAQYAQNHDVLIDMGYTFDALLPPEVQDIWGWPNYYYGLAGRRFINIEEFIHHPGRTWMTRHNVAAPQAVILTRGLDDFHADLNAYLAELGLQPVICLPNGIYAGETVLYVTPAAAAQMTPTCPPG